MDLVCDTPSSLRQALAAQVIARRIHLTHSPNTMAPPQKKIRVSKSETLPEREEAPCGASTSVTNVHEDPVPVSDLRPSLKTGSVVCRLVSGLVRKKSSVAINSNQLVKFGCQSLVSFDNLHTQTSIRGFLEQKEFCQ